MTGVTAAFCDIKVLGEGTTWSQADIILPCDGIRLMSSGAIAWYDRHGSTLVEVYESLDLKAAHSYLLDFLPARHGLILDVAT